MENIFLGKKVLIFGVSNERSIAWGVAKFMHEQGAKLAFCYQPGLMDSKTKDLIDTIDHEFSFACDLSSDSSLNNCFKTLALKWDSFDFLLHSVAFAKKEELKNRYIDTSRDGFLQALDISCFSFTKIVKLSEKFMNFGGSCVTLSYYGANKWIPNYNVMGVAKAALESSVRYLAMDLGAQGIRVNAISAGPIRTLASSGIADFHSILNICKDSAPLKRNVNVQDVAKSVGFLFSDLSSGITGQTIFVDAGYSILGATNASFSN